MTTHEKIDFAILETIKLHPDCIPTLNLLLYSQVTYKIEPKYFTSSNNARKYISEVTQDDILHYLLEEAIKCYNSVTYYIYNSIEFTTIEPEEARMKKVNEAFPGYAKLQKAIVKIADTSQNIKSYYQINTMELQDLITSVVQTRYQVHPSWREYMDKIGKGRTYVNKFQIDLFAKVSQDMSKTQVASNIQVNHAALNKCFSDVLSGAQLKNKHNNYGLDGNLYVAQDVGKKRTNQEDSALILTHPKNPNFKLLLVADGMGGAAYGEKASQYITQQLGIWFSNLPVELYKNSNKVQELLKKEIARISGEIYDRWNDEKNIRAGSTVATVVITETAAVTATVGDSRIYSVKAGELTLLSKDESAIWPSNKTQFTITTEELNDLRFHIYNNMITRCVGYKMEPSSVQSLIIHESLFEKIILLTDGVTDLLTQEEIKIISTTFPAHMITEQLVQSALDHDAKRHKGADDIHSGVVEAGKDNASAALYSRR